MPKKVKIGELGAEVSKIMQEYAGEVGEAAKEEAVKVAKEGKQKLRAKSPRGKGSKKGHYADGWNTKTLKESKDNINIALYNSKKPGLTHLLEKGHANRDGGRTAGIIHIEPVDDFITTEYEKRLKERLR